MTEETTSILPPATITEIPTDAPDTTEAPPAEEKLDQTVEVTDVGPCRKKIKVAVGRTAIDKRFQEKVSEIAKDDRSSVDGFRPGKAPRFVIERRYRSAVMEQLRNEVLYASLDQLSLDHKISPLAPPELDLAKLEIPKEGDFVYEFEVEVRPEFDLPQYKGIALKRPVHDFTPQEIEREKRRLLEPYGQLIPKSGVSPVVERDDFVIGDFEIVANGRVLNTFKQIRVRVERKLTLDDGVCENFAKTLAGAKAGDIRTIDIVISESAATEGLRGRTVQANITISEIKVVRLPELTTQFLRSEFDLQNEEQLVEQLEAAMNKRWEYVQRESYREQIANNFTQSATWELPQDLLKRQVKRALSKKIMEMREAGISDERISARIKALEQNAIQNTAVSLKEHFILQRIAEEEKIEVDEKEIEKEIDRIADESGESPRKVRARLEKDEMLDVLGTQILERKTLDLIIADAVMTDHEIKEEADEDEAASIEGHAAPAIEAPAETSGA